MAYKVKYITSYKRLSNNTTTITISEKNYTGSTSTLVADVNPLEIETTGDIENVYTPTQGSGAIINLLVTPLTLTSLFTTDQQKYIVKIYNGTTGGTLQWQGFVNTGIYQEDYSLGGNQLTPVQLTCNDGMSLLDDLSYKVSETGTTYQGCVTISEVLRNIFSKINITFTGIRTSSDLLVTAGVTNLFTGLFVNNENYLNENGIAMSCREVLNTIFQPLGLVVTLRADKIFIIDPINLHDTSKGKSYNATGGTETTTSLGGYLDLSSGLKYFETGQQFDIVQPYNQIEIKYDPYTWTDGGYDFGEEGNYTGGTFMIMTGASAGWVGNYWWNSGVTFNNGMILGYGVKGYGIKETSVLNDAAPQYYVQRNLRGNQDGTYTYTFPYSGIKQDDNIMLELSMDAFINTKHYVNIVNPTESTTPIQSLKMDNIEIKVGNRWWNGSTGKWQDSQYYGNKILVRQLDAEIVAAYRVHGTWFRKPVYYAAVDKSVINDTWTTAVMYIPLSELAASNVALLSGDITVKIYTGVNATEIATPWAGSGDNWYRIQNIMIKNLNMAIVKLDKTPIDNSGVLTILNINNALTRTKTPLSIELKNGCGLWGSSKGAFSTNELTPLGTNIVGLQRSGNATYYNTAKLLGQNLLSQYNTSRYVLNVNINAKDYLLNLDKYLIKDTTYLGSKAFYIANGVYNDAQESFQAQMIEITSTRDTISSAP